ncbi:hypothetical protein ACFV84_28295 [Kitasatospora sp. NPDC059811]|uniref:hypothetical protein n=1 Tax=Streptomycetaceae TaxID=2062 RepID=UPI00133192D5|nr:hypothetical protein [Streptomyces sp. MJM8645]
MLLVNLERSDESEALLHELIASAHPVAAGTATALLGVLLLYTDRWEEGRAHLRAAVDTARGPALQLARFHLAKLLIEQDEPERAAELVHAVVEDEPSEATEAARATLALLLVRAGKAEEAAELVAGDAGSADPRTKETAFAEVGEHLFDAVWPSLIRVGWDETGGTVGCPALPGGRGKRSSGLWERTICRLGEVAGQRIVSVPDQQHPTPSSTRHTA